MRIIKIVFLSAFIALCSFDANADVNYSFKFNEKTKISLVNQERGKELVATIDEYVLSMGYFDIVSKSRYKKADTITYYLINAVDNVREWTEKDLKSMYAIIETSSKKIRDLGINLNLPEEIEIVRTTGREEGGASGYTRMNFIVLAEGDSLTENIFLHELFHIFSRYNPELRDELYKVIGFNKMDNLNFPQILNDMEISNPDCPFITHYIEVKRKNGMKEKAAPFFYSPKDYDGGSFLNYADLALIAFEEKDGENYVKFENGYPLFLNPAEVEGFIEQVGLNTNYLIHPEEIAAENFVLAILGNRRPVTPIITEKFLEILRKK